ncbi:hypothetical protein GCM10022409_24690 [Hymenobacter glaciei]|uniref:TonB C-terminal domain-containing protein n=1 Tax=Hymenobacter glaciei TaxID=877209 RepID=A0ABP7U9L2_9BACT
MLPADSPFASLPTPGPHPATVELRAYAAGTLSQTDEHRIEAHSLDCERCAELLEGFSMSDAATTDQALAGLRTRLQARIAEDVPLPIVLPAGRSLWPRLAAAVALLGVVSGGIWSWEQRSAPAPVAVQHPTVKKSVKPIASTTTVASVAPSLPPQPVLVLTERPILPTPPINRPPICPPLDLGRQADYAAVRRPQAAGPDLSRRAAQPVASVLAEQKAEAAETTDGLASQSAPPATGTEALASRVATSPAPKPEASVAVRETAAPATVASMADSIATRQQEAIASRMMKAKAAPANSAALVANTPMPATVAIAPAPVAGTPAFNTYLRHEAAKFEPEEGAKPINGVVRLRFIVGADGKLSNLQVVRSMRADYDEEALRLVCEGPAWRPGIANGRRAALPMEITISF